MEEEFNLKEQNVFDKIKLIGQWPLGVGVLSLKLFLISILLSCNRLTRDYLG